MKDLEDKLGRCSLARPSPKLDKRVDQLFTEAAVRRPPVWARPMAMWQGAVACLVFATLGFLLHAALPEAKEEAPAPTMVYVVEMDPEMAERVFVSAPKPDRFLDGPVETRVEMAPFVAPTADGEGDVT
jgi:hypothetical protein